jgi:hypothetical protein
LRPFGGSSTKPARSVPLPTSGDSFTDKILIALFGAIFGAVLTIVSQIVIRRFSMRAEAFAARLDELCEDVRELARIIHDGAAHRAGDRA